jgi:hypothetical protein
MRCLRLAAWLGAQRRVRSGSQCDENRGRRFAMLVHALPHTTIELVILAVLFISAAPHATADLKVIELAIETRADTAVLPSGPASSLVVTPCTGCPPLSLASSARSRYFLGREQVSLDALKQRLASQPATMLLITYRKDTREITRIVATAQ